MIKKLKNITILLISILIFSCSKKITNKSILDEKHNYDWTLNRVIESNMFKYENPYYFKDFEIIRSYDFLNSLANTISQSKKDKILKASKESDELISTCGLDYEWAGLNDRCKEQTLKNWHNTFNNQKIIHNSLDGFNFISLDTNDRYHSLSIFMNDTLIFKTDNFNFKNIINITYSSNNDSLIISESQLLNSIKPEIVLRKKIPEFVNFESIPYFSYTIGNSKSDFNFISKSFLFIYPRSDLSGQYFYKW